MVDSTLVHFKTKENFKREKGNIQDTSIAFIKDSKQISTHDTVYNFVNWNVLDDSTSGPQLISFKIYGTKISEERSYIAEAGMTWEDFLNSSYDKISPEGNGASPELIEQLRYYLGYYTLDGIVYISAKESSSSAYVMYDSEDIAQTPSMAIIPNMTYTYTGER